MTPVSIGKHDRQRTEVGLDGQNVVVIDSFGFLGEQARTQIAESAKDLLEVTVEADEMVALIQIGPRSNVRSAHAY